MSITVARTIRQSLVSSAFRNEAKIIDGKKIAGEILDEVKRSVDNWVETGNRRPKLVALLVGQDPASKTYVSNKMKASKSVGTRKKFLIQRFLSLYTLNCRQFVPGIDSETILCPSDITQADLIARIHYYNADPLVDGILVQLPLPKGLSEREICQAVAPSKDVDGFHTENIGNLSSDRSGIVPATALGVKELIVRTKIDTFGKNAVVIGRSKNVGLPIALLLHADGNGNKDVIKAFR